MLSQKLCERGQSLDFSCFTSRPRKESGKIKYKEQYDIEENEKYNNNLLLIDRLIESRIKLDQEDKNKYDKDYDFTEHNQRNITGILKTIKTKYKQLKLRTYDITFDKTKYDLYEKTMIVLGRKF